MASFRLGFFLRRRPLPPPLSWSDSLSSLWPHWGLGGWRRRENPDVFVGLGPILLADPLFAPPLDLTPGSQTLYLCISPTLSLLGFYPSRRGGYAWCLCQCGLILCKTFLHMYFSLLGKQRAKEGRVHQSGEKPDPRLPKNPRGPLLKNSSVSVSPGWSFLIKREGPLSAITSWHRFIMGGRSSQLEPHFPR